jgi:hypothetical protein
MYPLWDGDFRVSSDRLADTGVDRKTGSVLNLGSHPVLYSNPDYR